MSRLKKPFAWQYFSLRRDGRWYPGRIVTTRPYGRDHARGKWVALYPEKSLRLAYAQGVLDGSDGFVDLPADSPYIEKPFKEWLHGDEGRD